MLGSWPLTVGAIFYFTYSVALIGAPLYAYLTGDPRFSNAAVFVALFLATVCALLGVAMIKARRGNTSWLAWVGGAAASLGGLGLFTVGWVNVAVFLLPMVFGFLGLSRKQHDG